MSRIVQLAFVCVLASSLVSTATAQTLKMGDPAPKLHVSKWLNGEPIKGIEKGKIYVVECWATWCGPCISAIPHVSKMNTQFKDKDVVFIGMNVWERDTSKVEPFIKKMGDKLNYRVALDVPGDGGQGMMATHWLRAAGRNGIPCTFVVDKESRIAWIGHPMAGLDQVVAKLVAGTYDAKAEAKKLADQTAFQTNLRTAFAAKNWDAAIKLVDGWMQAHPDDVVQATMIKFSLLLAQKKDYAAAYAVAQDVIDNKTIKESRALNAMAWLIATQQGIEQRNLDIALTLAERANEAAEGKSAPVLDTLARIQFDKGDIDSAIATQAKAVGLADKRMLPSMQKTLDKYKAAKK